MTSLLTTFKAISLIFSIASIATGLQAIIDPIGFSKTFGINLTSTSNANAKSYISLMGVRQLGTGLILLVFHYQQKYIEAATVLAIIGVLVAGTDGLYLARSGNTQAGLWHAGPGFCIAALAGAVLVYHE